MQKFLHINLLTLLLVFACLMPVFGQPVIHFETTKINAGLVEPKGLVEGVFIVKNLGTGLLKIESVSPT